MNSSEKEDIKKVAVEIANKMGISMAQEIYDIYDSPISLVMIDLSEHLYNDDKSTYARKDGYYKRLDSKKRWQR